MPCRWWIAILVTVAIAISYLDRLTLSVAIDAVRQDIAISDGTFARLNIAFLMAYGLMYMGGGRLIDVLGTRRGFFLVMVFWSLACASHGLALGFWMLAISRLRWDSARAAAFLRRPRLWPSGFPCASDRAPWGLSTPARQSVGDLAPPLIAAIVLAPLLGWRWVFFLTGGIGLVWTVWWLWEYHAPSVHPRITPKERAEIVSYAAAAPADAGGSWISLLGMRAVWGLVLAKFLSDAAWFFYSFWLPKYLLDVRDFNTKEVGYYAWIPYAASGVGSLLGGAFSSWLLRRNYSLNAARKIALGASAALMPWVFFVTKTDVSWAIVLFSVAFFGQQAWSTLVMTLPADIFPRRVVGSVAGLVGFGGAMGGVAFNYIAGEVLDRYKAADQLAEGYQVVFAMSSTFHVLAFVWILLMVRRVGAAAAAPTTT